jgi:hypothetical protein
MAGHSYTLNFDEIVKFIKKLFIFIVLMFIVDRCLGYQLDYFFNNKLHYGSFGIINRAIKDRPDIVILGASRAHHNYIPKIITKDLNMSCYNLGLDGMNMLYHYSLLVHILSHYKPKFIIYDFLGTEIDKTWAGSSNYDKLMPIIKNYDDLIQLIKFDDKYINIKLLSFLYSYNRKLHSLIKDSFIFAEDNNFCGYIPLYGADVEKIMKNNIIEKTSFANEDDFLELIFNYFITKLTKEKISFVLIFSPIWKNVNDEISPRLSKILKSNGVTLHIINKDYYQNLDNLDLYKDLTHLNANGAKIYSEIINLKLKKWINHL